VALLLPSGDLLPVLVMVLTAVLVDVVTTTEGMDSGAMHETACAKVHPIKGSVDFVVGECAVSEFMDNINFRFSSPLSSSPLFSDKLGSDCLLGMLIIDHPPGDFAFAEYGDAFSPQCTCKLINT
jgi:hypothetical protein